MAAGRSAARLGSNFRSPLDAPESSDEPETTQAPDSSGACANSDDFLLELAGRQGGGHGIRTRNRFPGI